MPSISPTGMGDKFRTYLALETSWWVALYAICFRYQPTVAIMKTPTGSAAVQRVGGWLRRVWPSRYEKISAAAANVYTSPNGRTFGEWLLINKVLAPVSFPAKLALANRIVNQRAALATAGAAALAVAQSAEPDLTDMVSPINVVIRTVSSQAKELPQTTATRSSSAPREG